VGLLLKAVKLLVHSLELYFCRFFSLFR